MFATRALGKYFTSGRTISLVAIVAISSISMSLHNTSRNRTLCESTPAKLAVPTSTTGAALATAAKANMDTHSVTRPSIEVQVVIPPAADADDIAVVPDDEEDAAWIAEKEKCSFCRMFIHSPCKRPFKAWSTCVDKAKEKDEDFAQVCSDYTKALMECTSENTEYFQALEQRSEEEDEGEEGHEAEGESTVTPAEIAASETEKITDEEK